MHTIAKAVFLTAAKVTLTLFLVGAGNTARTQAAPSILIPGELTMQGNTSLQQSFQLLNATPLLAVSNFTVLSLNPTLVPNSPNNLRVNWDVSYDSHTLDISPAWNQWGTAELWLTVTDQGYTVSNKITLIVEDPTPPVVPRRTIAELLSWVPAEGNAQDLMGAVAATPQNGVGYGPGKLGQAFTFDGQDDSVELRFPDPTSTVPRMWSPSAVDCWIHPSEDPTEASVIFSVGESANPMVQLALVRDALGKMTLVADFTHITNRASLVSTSSIPAGAWTHVALSLTYSAATLYVNGVSEAQFTGTIFYPRWPPFCYLGKGKGGAFRGRIDEVALYNWPPSDTDIRDICELGRVGQPVPPIILTEPAGASVGVGENVRMEVRAISHGGSPLSYQWQFNGTNLEAQTNSVLELINLTVGQSGGYSVKVSSTAGSAQSKVVELAVSGVVVWDQYGPAAAPKNLMNIIATAAAENESMALRNDGTLFWWSTGSTSVSSKNFGYTNFLDMACASDKMYLLFPNHELATVDWNGNVTSTMTNVASVSANNARVVVLKTDGRIEGWSDWIYGGPRFAIDDLTNAVTVEAGMLHHLALKADGTVAAFGAFAPDGINYGQLNVPPGLSNVVAVSGGYFHSLALKADGTLAAWGGVRSSSIYYPWTTNIPPEATNIVAIKATMWCNLALRGDGRIIQWQSDPPEPRILDLPNVVGLSAGLGHIVFLLKDGAPQVTIQPWDQNVDLGSSLSFSPKIVGKKGLQYQWRFNDLPVPGATNSSLVITSAVPANEGEYSLVASNEVGSVMSRKAKLKVVAANGTTWAMPGAMSQGTYSFSVRGTPGFSYIVQSSTNLLQWSDLQTNVPADELWEVQDPTAWETEQRFYRVKRLEP